VIGTSNTSWTPGFHDCDRGILMPDIKTPDYAERLLNVCVDERIDVLLSCFDPDLAAIASIRQQLRDLGVYCAFPDEHGVTASFDKYKTWSVACESGIRTPETVTREDAALTLLESGKLRWPLIVRPRFGFASNGLTLVENAKQLNAAMQNQTENIIQQCISGEEINIDGLAAEDSEALSIVPGESSCRHMAGRCAVIFV
jgi:carbamoyl-phosphate synthase large subunit